MSIINLASDDTSQNEVIEILSSPQPVQHAYNPECILTSSPLFDFEQQTQQSRTISEPLSPSPKKRKTSIGRESGGAKQSTERERERERERLEEEIKEKERIEKERIESERIEIEKERIEKERLEKERLESERIEIERLEREKKETSRVEIAARKESTEVIPRKRPQFKASSAEPATKSSSKVAATSKASDRKVAGEKVVATLWIDNSNWQENLQTEFTNLGVSVTIKSSVPQIGVAPEGLTMLLTLAGQFDDEWDMELETFVKTNVHPEQIATSLVCIDASFLDTMGVWTVEQRQRYFDEIAQFAAHQTNCKPMAVIYFFPEVGAHFRKRVDKFNRQMRRRVAAGESSASDTTPPDEYFYTNLEAELQILNDIRAHYPRKPQDAAEMVANCIVDLAASRYTNKIQETVDIAGAYVRSKSTPLEITIESLTKVQGLPPRIATKLGTEMQTLGGIWPGLGNNTTMRESRVKRFGQGTWNAALLTLLEESDPNLLIS